MIASWTDPKTQGNKLTTGKISAWAPPAPGQVGSGQTKGGIDVSSHPFNPLNKNSQFVDPNGPSNSAFPQINPLKEALKPSSLGSAATSSFPQSAQAIQDLKNDPLNLKNKDVMGSGITQVGPFVLPKQSVTDAWNSIKDTVKDEGSRIADYFKTTVNPFSTATPAQRLNANLKVVTGAANVVFSPITALFEGAKDIPVLGSVAKAISIPFSTMGEGGAGLANAIINKLPVSDTTKEQLKPGVKEIFSLAGQLLAGEGIAKVTSFGTLKDTYGEADAKTIVDQAIKLADEQKKTAFPQSNPTMGPKPGSLADEAAQLEKKGTEPVRGGNQNAIETALNSGDTAKAQQLVDELPATDPYKKSMQSIVDTEKAPVEKTPSKIGKSIETKAIESGLTNKFEGVAGYDKINIKDQAERASALLENMDKARAVVRGDESLPEGLKGTALITAMEEHLKNNPDPALAEELANSPHVSATSAAAQEMRLAAEREPDSAAARLAELKKNLVDKAGGEKAIAAKKSGALKTTKGTLLPKEDLSWDKFLENIKC